MSPEELSKGEITRAAILAAARDLFITQGYNGTSMRQIAQRAGIALGASYNHFGSKAEIFRAVFLQNHPFLEMLPAIEAAQGETVEAFIRDAAVQMLAAMGKNSDFLNLMFIELVEFKSVHSTEIFAQAMPRAVAIIDRLTEAQGNLRQIPAPMLARIFIGLFFTYYLAESMFASIAPVEFSEHAMDHYIEVFLHGILEP